MKRSSGGRIALATCARLPHGTEDERPLHDALRAAGLSFEHLIWTDASPDLGAYDACVIRTTWDYQTNLPRFLDWVDHVGAVTRLVNPPDTVRWNANKSYLFDLETRGIPIVPTVHLARSTTPDLSSITSERNWGHAVLKPIVGATARETIRFTRDDLERGQAHADRLLPQEDLLLQPFLERVLDEGETSAMYFGGGFGHAVRKRARAGDYRVQGDFGGTDESVALDSDERELAERTLAAVPSGWHYARVDMLRLDDGTPVLAELELIEPALFFRRGPASAEAFARALRGVVDAG